MSYEAKRRGVVRGMRLFEVKKVCPDCVIVPSDYETYSLVSKRFFEILRRYTPDLEEYSIDEAFADLSGLRRVYRKGYVEIAAMLKETVERELGISVSLGLSTSKSLAKIASKEGKPSGTTLVPGRAIHTFLADKPLERVCGFGPNTVALLSKHGLKTVLDFARLPEIFSKKWLGKIGIELWHELRGAAVYRVHAKPAEDLASISKSKTFTPPSNNREFVRAQLARNLESAFIKLRRHGLRVKIIGIHLRDERFAESGFSAELTRATSSTLEAMPIIGSLFDRVFKIGVRYRQTGVYLFKLESTREVQYDLFEDPCEVKKMHILSQTADEINAIYGKHCLHIGSTNCLGRYQQHVGDRGDVPIRKIHYLKGETFRQHLNIPLWNIPV